MNPHVAENQILALADKWRAVAHETIRSNQQLSNLWHGYLQDAKKAYELDLVYANDSKTLLDLVNQISDIDCKAFRTCLDYSSRRSVRFREVEEIIVSIQRMEPEFLATIVVCSSSKVRENRAEADQALVPVKTSGPDFNNNDKRFLRSLRIGVS